MALARPLFVGFSSASRQARDGCDLEVTVQTAAGPRTFTLPWFFVRDVDALLERWRREEHEATLLTMNGGVLGATLVDAARAGGLRDVTFLLARGADVNYPQVNENGATTTALWTSSYYGHLAVVTALLDAGAQARGQALTCAAGGGRTTSVALLLDRGVDIHWEDDCPLREAARQGKVNAVRLLLDRGADVHALNDAALLEARRNGHEAVVALLVERGAVDPEE